ncbi:MAG: hypothetical protein ACYC4S_00530 [Rhodoferax sp.]
MLQTTPTKRQPARRTPSAEVKLPFPELPETGNRFFWLASLFRKLAELQALERLTKEQHQRRRSNVVLFALYGATSNLQFDLRTDQGYVVQGGLLPFAFAGTTVFNTKPVAA